MMLYHFDKMAQETERAEELARAARYRFRAVELRSIAANGVDPAIKDTLLQVADDYVAMARSMESTYRTMVAINAVRKQQG